MRLAVLRVGPVELDVAQTIQQNLEKIFPATTCTLLEHAMSIPREAYNKGREQYSSTKILMDVQDHLQDLDTDRVLAVTSVDLYASRLNFVFGEAECPGRVAIISLFRLRPKFYGQPPNEELYVKRCVKEAVHEVGHMLGLSHCHDSSCVMFFSNSIIDTDHKETSFCDKCRQSVDRHLTESQRT